jgi:hypothetical protein
MRQRGVRVVATVNTIAASMGSVILMAADEIRIVEGGRIMIHEASQMVAGDSADHARAAKMLDEISEEIAQIYANRTGATKEEMRAAMKAETWMGAKEAVERKFADSIVKFSVDIRDEKPTPGVMSFLSALFPDKSDAIAKLESEVAENATLRDSLATAEAKITELQNLAGEIAVKDLKIADLTTQVDEITAQITAKDEEIAKLTESAKITETKVNAAAVATLATIGQEEPIKVESGAPAEENKMTLLAFNSLTPAARMKFIKSGGKISN